MKDYAKDEIDLDGPIGDWLVLSIGAGAKLLRSKHLICGPSSPVHLIEAEFNDHTERFVLRLFVDQKWINEQPDLAQHEAAALQHATACGVPAPQLVAFSPDSSICGHSAVLMTFLDGSVDLTPSSPDDWLGQMAETLAAIHAIPSEGFAWRYFSFTDVQFLKVPAWSRRPDLWEEAIRIRLAGPPQEEAVFLHRDYHPVNTLWEAGKLVGVVDWVSACLGPAGVDVAHCCMNLASMFGIQVANIFREKYQRAAGSRFVYHAYWDIDSIIGWGTPQPGFYPQWLEYGLKNPGQQALFDRQDEYLQSVMNGI